MTFIFYLAFFLASTYFLMNLVLVLTWLYIPKSSDKSYTQKFSIIVPVRNEAENILQLLQDFEALDYPESQFEVLIMDDASTDETAQIVANFQKNTKIDLKLCCLPERTNNTSPKKRAIQEAIALAKFDTLVRTDGDCRVQPNYLAVLSAFYDATDAYFVSMPVSFGKEENLFDALQSIEFASLIGTGACAMQLRKPNMCNGANLSYRKWVFNEVNGFVGNEALASGDDEFLMHKVAKRFPEKVQFLKSFDTLVQTQAHQSLKSFFNQRLRWASKWKHYQNWTISALAVFVFLSNLLIIGTMAFALISINKSIISLFFLKFSAEFIFLALMMSFFKKSRLIVFIPFVQIIYPFYVVFFGLFAQGKGYEWKGRKLS